MLQFIAEQNVVLYAMAVVGVLGAISQVVLFSLYGRLLKDTENTVAPKGKFMKQLRQRYIITQRLNEGMADVSVFVKKSLMEYRWLGMNLHQWRRMGGTAFVVCALLGVGGYYITGTLHYAENIRQNYLWATLAAGLLLAGVQGLTDIGYKKKYLMTGLENLFANSGMTNRYQPVPIDQSVEQPTGNMKPEAKIERRQEGKKIPDKSIAQVSSMSRKKRSSQAETQAQRDKRELKENLAKLKEGISETAAVRDREKERNTEILRQMDPEEQERVIREVLKEFLS